MDEKDLEKYIEEIEKDTGKSEKEIEKELKLLFESIAALILMKVAEAHSKYEKGGKLTYEEMNKYKRMDSLISSVNAHINDLIKGEYKHIAKGVKSNYKQSYEFLAYAFEKETQAYLNFSKLTEKQLQAILDNPMSGLTLNDTLQKNRAQIIYNVKRTLTQAIYNGYSYGKTANLLKGIFQDDYVKAVRVARTEIGRAVEMAKYESALKAQETAVKQTKTWLSVRDSRVRDAHIRLHNKTVPLEKDFDLGDGLKGKGPRHTGYAQHDINCRCRLKYTITDVDKPVHSELSKMQFEEWKKKRLK